MTPRGWMIISRTPLPGAHARDLRELPGRIGHGPRPHDLAEVVPQVVPGPPSHGAGDPALHHARPPTGARRSGIARLDFVS